jgi:hypothetical protein
MTVLIHRLRSLHNRPGQAGLLGVGRTKLHEDFLLRDERDPLIPGTDVKRIRTVPLGVKAVGVTDAEVRRVVEGLERCAGRAERNRRPTQRSAKSAVAHGECHSEMAQAPSASAQGRRIDAEAGTSRAIVPPH